MLDQVGIWLRVITSFSNLVASDLVDLYGSRSGNRFCRITAVLHGNISRRCCHLQLPGYPDGYCVIIGKKRSGGK